MRSTDLLTLLQLSDSAFPTGSFSHSMGLEAAQVAGELDSARALKSVIAAQLDALATSDCVAMRASHRAASVGDVDEICRIDGLLAATKLTRELRAASAATGRGFLRSVLALGTSDELLGDFDERVRGGDTPGNLAVVQGMAGWVLGLDEEETLLSYLYSTAASLVAAGQKLVPLGGGAAQRVLYELREEIESAAERCEALEIEEIYSFTPLLDVRSMMHENQRTRLYIS